MNFNLGSLTFDTNRADPVITVTDTVRENSPNRRTILNETKSRLLATDLTLNALGSNFLSNPTKDSQPALLSPKLIKYSHCKGSIYLATGLR